MEAAKYLILGGGMVAGYAAKELVAGGLKPDELTILSADDALPYERPPLSKSFLAGKDTEESILINPSDFYRDHGIRIKLGTPVDRLDLKSRRLHVSSGEEYGFERLVLATGARVRKLDLPGSQLQGILYLRSLRDSTTIRDHAASAKRAVIIGAGFIGMEVASVLARKGIETTQVFPEDRIWKNFFTPGMSTFFEGYYAARGVTFRKGSGIAAFEGNGAVKSATLTGGEKVPCDLVVAGIGVVPVTDPFDGSGLEIQNGVIVNEYLETRHAGVYAAGDVANYQDTLFGKRRRVEHWDNAVSQGQHCAGALLGRREPFVHVPYFFSDVFDLSYEFWGDTSSATRIVHRGDLGTNSFSVWWLEDARLVAAFAMNRPDEEREAAPEWIRSRQPVSAERLRDQSRSLRDAAGQK